MVQAGAVLGGRYVLEEPIGYGGYGEVWRAADAVLSRAVAIKLLHPRYAEQSEAVARFRAEARHAAALSHENIARVYDYGEAAGGQPPYLVMELVAGDSLEAVLAGGPLDATRTMDIVAQAAAGLQAAHAAGMVHRDVKPANLLLAPGDTVKVTDFGIAHTVDSASVTLSGELVGTPAYLAPERTTGEQASPASDLYSLGIVAYECLAGDRPFAGPPLEVALAHRDRPLPPLPASAGPDVTAFVMRLTAKDPARRLGDAAEVTAWASLLRDGMGTGPAAVRRGAGTGPRDRDQARRRAVLAYACAALAAVIIIVIASVIGFASPPRPVAASSAGPASPAPSSSSSSSPASVSRGRAAATPRSSRQAANPARLSAASHVARQQPPPVEPVVRATTSPGSGPGDGNGPGDGPGKGNGPGDGPGKGNGPGNGNGHGHGDQSSQGS